MYIISLSKEWGKFLQDHLIYEENKYTHIGRLANGEENVKKVNPGLGISSALSKIRAKLEI